MVIVKAKTGNTYCLSMHVVRHSDIVSCDHNATQQCLVFLAVKLVCYVQYSARVYCERLVITCAVYRCITFAYKCKKQ
ncbi:unnamed protein product [Parnassius apollo]|uniref:(apollo) hypothetical protein n=1 Tax=Parnassius apollo TaxID=110799 RepID=A0A8S3WPL6_PARAO|nr:unnamed protein product [Parnassius apollo]